MTKKSKPGIDPAKLRERLGKTIRKPEVLLALLAGALPAGDAAMPYINAALDADLPGWAVLAGVAGYIGLRWGWKLLEMGAAFVAEFRAFRDETRARLDDGDLVIEELRTGHSDHERRIVTLENVARDEADAYSEKGRRETGPPRDGAG